MFHFPLRGTPRLCRRAFWPFLFSLFCLFSSAFGQVNLLYEEDGSAFDNRLGFSVSGVGDVNGDGRADFMVGSPYSDPGGVFNAGVVLVYSGSTGGVLYQINGNVASDYLGWSVGGAGDVNGDGRADFIVGTLSQALVYSGATGGLLYQKGAAGGTLGVSVGGVGDINGDGKSDFIVGAPGADPGGITDAGSAYVYSGATGGLLYQKDGTAPGDALGNAVGGAGDVNGDGIADFIVGAQSADNGGSLNVGGAFVYSGATGALLYSKYGALGLDNFGSSVSGAGDVNGDGRSDFIVGARYADGGAVNTGGAFVYSGATGGLLYQKYGTLSGDNFGRSVSGAGDVDGDGKADFIVGASGADAGGLTDAGSAFLYSGASGALLYQKNGLLGDQLGYSVSGAGDLNGDGKADFLIGAPYADPASLFDAGSALVYGFAVSPPPPSAVISFSPALFSFTAVQSGSLPSSQNLQITNTGGGTLNWSLVKARNSSWLSATPVSGTAPSTAAVSVSTSALTVGIYYDTLVISGNASNSPQRVPVIYTVTAPPNPAVISLSPASFSFSAVQSGSLPLTQNLLITNTGGGTLSWSLVKARNSSWLSASPVSGTAPSTAVISISTTGLTVGSYYDTLVISGNASNSPQRVPVIYTVTAPPNPAVISLSPTALSFTAAQSGSLPSSQNLQITNTGGGTLSWSLVKARNSSWLSASPVSGTAPSTAAVSVSTSALTVGIYYDTLVVSGNASNSPQRVPVIYTVTAPPNPAVISFSPASLSFTAVQSGSLPSSQNLQISNTGGGTLNWSLVKARNSSWLSASPVSGTAPSTVTVSISTTGLTPGSYYDTLVVSSTEASNSPQRLPVTYTVTASPVISLSPIAFSFTAIQSGSLPSSQNLQIGNTGGGTLNWTLAKARNSSWLSASPVSGTAPSTVVISISTTGLSTGSYYDTLVISGNASNSPQRVPVTYTVTAPPNPAVISLSPASFSFSAVQSGSLPLTQNLLITNTGGGTLSWSLVKARNSSWLSATPVSGTAPSTVMISVTTTGLAVGTYYDTLMVSGNANNSPQRVPVTYAVTAPPNPAVISLSPTSFGFMAEQSGSLPSSQNLQISNTGGGTLNWMLTKARNSGWLSASPVSGTAPGTVIISIATTGLVPNTYYDTLVITSAEASNSPQRVPVSFRVTAPKPGKGFVALSTATCGDISVGTLPDLTQICYSVKNGKIWNPTPSSFLYLTQVTASSSSFTLEVVQAKNNASVPLFDVAGNGITLYDGNCTAIGTGISPSPGQAQIGVTGATIGQTYVLSVKYSTNGVSRTVIGSTAPSVHYDFVTKVNGIEVIRDADGLNLTNCAGAAAARLAGTDALESLENYPNPFNANTTLRYSLTQDARVRIDILNILGARIRTLVDAHQTAGEHEVSWSGTDAGGASVASGIYFFKVDAGGQVRVKRMTLLK